MKYVIYGTIAFTGILLMHKFEVKSADAWLLYGMISSAILSNL